MKIYSVEISNLCNLTCSYCPHPSQKRDKGMMSFSTFVDVIELAIQCEQNLLHLHNFGEPLLHVELPKFINYAKSRGIRCSFYTNGLLLNESLAKKLYRAGLREIYLSEHIEGQKKRIQKMLEEIAIPLSIVETYNPHADPQHNWAGQVTFNNYPSSIQNEIKPCIFERKKAIVVLWDGQINTCCIDINGTGIIGSVKDFIGENKLIYNFKPIALCQSCNLMRGEEVL